MHRLHAFPDIREMLRRLVIAVFIGLASALVVWLFRQAMYLLENAFLGDHGGSLVAAASALAPWRRVLTPAAGGLLAGLLLWSWQRATRQRPSAPTDYMEAIETGDGRLDVPSSLVKSAASLIVVASGSAIGREGAMILLATVFASLFAQRFTPNKEWKLWVACGAAAGMASAYHAPLAGSLFIAEILFGSLMLASLGPVVIAAVSALLMTHLLNGGQTPLYIVTLLDPPQPSHYGLMALLGLTAGVAGPLMLWLLAKSSALFRGLKLSPPLQLALGGLIVGLLSLVTPTAWGNGYSVVQSFLSSPPALLFVAGVLLCKLLAVMASSGSGAPGGVFTPTLFMGAALGMLFGQICGLWGGGEPLMILLGLTGMASLLAATTHAPIMATLMICEMTGEFTLLPGLLLTCVIASTLSRWLRPQSVYRQGATQPG
ncbi:voltage-gated ClC-type chloride channel ClcB [Cedecea neteri]|uniref:Voltage-gated ClC-type chloride channel ClcB n=1 Tax=Cedecea neteri TaxID=158822 RepID=A0A291DYJ9_9ENTR|nr:voltage-gated ClC-type chloride channel ClcB [Cedecea neteri]ATF92884.1 voltage-gated ClC-type chloride channel ClcB [Cedecea neteri]